METAQSKGKASVCIRNGRARDHAKQGSLVFEPEPARLAEPLQASCFRPAVSRPSVIAWTTAVFQSFP
jgi:hypothetical protein